MRSWLLTSAAILVSLPAYAETTMTVLNSSGSVVNIPAETSTVGGVSSITLHSVPEIGGLAVASGNPMPTTDATAESSLSTIATNTAGLATSAKQPALVSGGVPSYVLNFPSMQPISGNVGLNAGTASIGTVGLNAGSQIIGSVNINGTPGVSVTSLPTLSAGSNTIGNVGLNAGSQTIGNVGINGTVPISGSVGVIGTLPVNVTTTVLPPGAATLAAQGTVTAVGSNITTGNIQVIQGATSGQPVPVSGSVTQTPNTVTYTQINCTATTSSAACGSYTFPHGGDILNPASNTANICFAFNATASASTNCLTPGTAYHLPFPTMQPLNVYASATSTVQGLAY